MAKKSNETKQKLIYLIENIGLWLCEFSSKKKIVCPMKVKSSYPECKTKVRIKNIFIQFYVWIMIFVQSNQMLFGANIIKCLFSI